MKNNKIYFTPRCVIRVCEPRKTLMTSKLTGGSNSTLSEESGSWGTNSGESMGIEEGNW